MRQHVITAILAVVISASVGVTAADPAQDPEKSSNGKDRNEGRCTRPFKPAGFGPTGDLITPADAECRTSDITLAELKTLTGKMDGFNPSARTPQEYLAGTPNFRTDLYSGPTSGHLLTYKESIALFEKLGVMMTPELKAPSVTMPFNGFTQAACAQKMIDEYKAARVSPSQVWPQSFDQRDILYWVNHEPAFGKQAVYLDDANVPSELPSFAELVGSPVATPEIGVVQPDPEARMLPAASLGATAPSGC